MHTGSGIKYQKRDAKANWKKRHIKYSIEVYECAQDLRKLTKKSISLVISEVIIQFLDEMLDFDHNQKNWLDNSLCFYLFSTKIDQGTLYYTITWGPPDEKRSL